MVGQRVSPRFALVSNPGDNANWYSERQQKQCKWDELDEKCVHRVTNISILNFGW